MPSRDRRSAARTQDIRPHPDRGGQPPVTPHFPSHGVPPLDTGRTVHTQFHQESAVGIDSTLPNFRALSPAERLAHIAAKVELTEADVALLAKPGALPLATADGMIENVIGTFELPLGVAGNFQINGKDVLVPMAVEEPSVIAAASYMAKLARVAGGFQTSSSGPIMRAQVQLIGVTDPYGARQAILQNREEILRVANSRDKVLISLGGGCRDIEVHVFPDTARGPMVVTHLIVDVRDAMGANTVNTMAEAVAPVIEQITGGKVRLRILSNLADLRLARARVRISPSTLATSEYSGEDVINRIVDAYEFAAVDPYRAATHNKGIMNGIDPVVVATGNDWRAVEAGAHAFACRSGQYTSLTRWEIATDGDLIGSIEMPMPLGLVGGATKTHPLARLALKIMKVTSAQELAEITVAVGLAQNMGALRALATEGIQRGHMALHARNIALVAGATGDDVDWVVRQMVAAKDVRVEVAQQLLAERKPA
jgi:hydroxymethylglutaryl-CoA reductase